ncbi:hypothetical protein [Spirosoma sp.]|uniref:hypothetical protein n=1 Tax=Spirosoma sp. TaxID=1899569 RepID=UPI00261B2108|nr:hypothetical protein [Spirosoma sp.]MCX6218924.1 hypothetical protein [Spirosoma sp.]
MRNFTNCLVLLLVLPAMLSCGSGPLEKKYRSQTMWYDIRVGSNAKNDSINHALCRLAVDDNTSRKVKSEDFTYQELIDQGYDLLAKTHTEGYVDSLREAHSKP